MKVSVAMAYYNGGQFIKEQIDSILCQIKGDGEIIISVDGAFDGSDVWLEFIEEQDERIHVIKGPGKGVVKNFENAISHCSGDVIFIADQDDIWEEDKVRMVLKGFQNSEVMVILHNGVLADENGEIIDGPTLFDLRGTRKGIMKNLVKNSYMGCCMAFRRELLPIILPIPEAMYMHDYWIGTAGEYMGSVGFIKKPLLKYRRHGGNVTQMEHDSWDAMVKKRMNMVKCLNILKKRIKVYRRKNHE